MMRNGIAGLDHVIVGVRDLERARLGWSRLGFTLSPRGHHIGQDTANCCIMFPADYIELLGHAAANDASRPGRFLADREGLMALAFAPERSAEETRAALGALGLHPSELRPLGRRIETPEGTVVPRFSLVSLPPEEAPGLDCFVCDPLTPGLMRRPEWLAHANGATALAGVHVLTESTALLLPAYDRLFGLAGVTTTDAVVSIHVGRHRIVFSTPDDFRTMHPRLDLDPAFPLPGIVSLEICVERVERTALWLRRGKVPFAGMPDGSLVIPAGEANGAILFLSENRA